VSSPPTAAPHAEQRQSLTPLLGVYAKPAVEFVRGRGVELFDASGRSYLDFTSGIAVNALGYGDAGLERVLGQATQSGLIHTSNLYATAPVRELAQALVSRSFADRVFFCNSGAEANEGAFKFARRWARSAGSGGDEKHGIIALRGSFHGRLFGTLAATDRPAYRAPFLPLAGGIFIVEATIDALEAAITERGTAALILEPVQGEGGVNVLSPEFLRDVRALTRERRVALILDEIQCGLGRTGKLFAYEHAGITPDIMTLAKPLAGGLPMGAALMTEEIAAAMSVGDHGSTFGGGPFVSTVARYVFERLSDPALLAHVRDEGAWLGQTLDELATRCATVRGAHGVGFMWGVDVAVPAKEIVARALTLGLLVCTAGEHTVRLLPPLVMKRESIREGIELLEQALADGGVKDG